MVRQKVITNDISESKPTTWLYSTQMEAPDGSGLGSNPPAGSSGPSLGVSIPAPLERSGSQTGNPKSAHVAAHRQSFADNQRYPPPSPRTHRHPSFTQQAIQDLMNNPPTNRHANPRYAGRDWRDLPIGEFASPEEVRWVEYDTSVEEATMVSNLSFWSLSGVLTCVSRNYRHFSRTTRTMLYSFARIRPPIQLFRHLITTT